MNPEDYPVSPSGTGRVVGGYIVTGTASGFRVIENGGAYRILKKVFKTFEQAAKRAEAMSK